MSYAVWYHRDNGSMRGSDVVIFDCAGRDPEIITRALGGRLVVEFDAARYFDATLVETIPRGVGRRLGDTFHISPPNHNKASQPAIDKHFSEVLDVTAGDPELRQETFNAFVEEAKDWWYARFAIEFVHETFFPGATVSKEEFIARLASKQRAKLWDTLLAKNEALAAWNAERGPHGHRGLGILPRERYHAEHHFLIYDPREDDGSYDRLRLRQVNEKLFQWLPLDRRFRLFQHHRDDLLVAVELH